jgi:hypothetical protein
MSSAQPVCLASLDSKVDLPGLDDFRVLLHGKHTGIYYIPAEQAEKLLGMPADRQLMGWQQLEQRPVCKRGELIEPGGVQWVSGNHEALEMFRKAGAPLKRTKMCLQVGDPIKNGFTSYKCPYRQKQVLPATADVADCPPALASVNAINRFMVRIGGQPTNHFILTRYVDGNDSIGYHSDDPSTIAKSGANGESMIVIIKGGENARHFSIRRRAVSTRTKEQLKRMTKAEKEAHKKEVEQLQNKQKPFFNQVVHPCSVILMTVDANNGSQHGVLPEEEECGKTESITARTIVASIPARKLVGELKKKEVTKTSKEDKRPSDAAKAAVWDKKQEELRVANEERRKMKLRVAAALENRIDDNSKAADVDSTGMVVDPQPCASSKMLLRSGGGSSGGRGSGRGRGGRGSGGVSSSSEYEESDDEGSSSPENEDSDEEGEEGEEGEEDGSVGGEQYEKGLTSTMMSDGEGEGENESEGECAQSGGDQSGDSGSTDDGAMQVSTTYCPCTM